MCGKSRTKSDSGKRIHLLRQLLINSGTWSSFFIMGLNTGAPTVVVPQLRNEANSTDAVTPEEASWLPVIFSYSGLPWVFLLPMIAAYCGRKITHIVVCSTTFIGFIVFYCSSDVHQIMISEFFQGPVMVSYFAISIIIITEYTSLEYRGVFLDVISATFFWGILVANTIGTFFHWKNIPLLGMMCSGYSLLTVYFWPESPLWLAKKRRFDQCAESHRWIKGSDANAEIELETLIATNQVVEKKLSIKSQTIVMIKILRKKEFYKPVLLSILLLLLYTFSGKLVCTIYAIDILKKITNNTSTAFIGMLILDAVTVFTMYVGCALAKKCKRRTLLFISSIIGVLFLYTLALYLYLVKLSIISEDKYVSISLLSGFSIAIGAGLMNLAPSISGELVPTESRSFALCLMALSTEVKYSTFTKISPYIFSYLGMHGTFLFFAISSTICMVLIYIYVPETKDKTWEEIKDSLLGIKPIEEAKELLPIKKNNVIITPRNRKISEEFNNC